MTAGRDLWSRLIGTAKPSASLSCWSGTGFERVPWRQVIAEARLAASVLRSLGVGPGQPVASILTNSLPCVRGLLGTWFAGGVLASLPVPARGMGLAEYGRQLTSLCERLGSELLLVEERLAPIVREVIADEVAVVSWESIECKAVFALDPIPPQLDAPAFVQFSSGSTGLPKGCMLTSRAIGEQLELLAEMLSLTAGDGVGVSWLPLSHDMGFFGVLLFTLAWDLDLVLSSPERFLTSPRTWIGDIADAGGTLTAGTSSALHVATRAQRSRRLARRLDLRAAIIGAERIDWTTLQRAVEVFGPFGLALENIMPAFGLAEATLAVTAVGLNESPSALALDAIALADGELVEVGGGAPHATSVVCLGRPCRDVRVAFAVPDRLSEMEVWSPSLASGYLGDPVLSAERFSNGGVRTGDLGFERDGKTYVVGRMDDMVSVRGRNVYTREIEASVDLLPDVRAGCSTIVDASDSQRTRLVMLVELKNGAGDTADIAAEAAGCAMRKAGIRLDECVFLEAGTLPKTPSGKIQRFRCRQLLTTEQMSVLARVVLSTAVTN